MLFADAQILLLPWVSIHQFFEQMWQIFTVFYSVMHTDTFHMSTEAVPLQYQMIIPWCFKTQRKYKEQPLMCWIFLSPHYWNILIGTILKCLIKNYRKLLYRMFSINLIHVYLAHFTHNSQFWSLISLTNQVVKGINSLTALQVYISF